MQDITVITDNGTIAVASPYSKEFVEAAKTLGGRWNSESRTWEFSTRDEQRVRDLLHKLFGTDGNPHEAADLVTVRTALQRHECSHRDEDGPGRAVFAGRLIARRPTRNSPVKLSDGVVLVEGTLSRGGGSARYPEIDASSDVIVEIRDIPRSILTLEDGDCYEIIEQGTAGRAALLAERAALLARLSEIDAQLGAAAHDSATA